MAVYELAAAVLPLSTLFILFAWLARRERARILAEVLRQVEETGRYDSLVVGAHRRLGDAGTPREIARVLAPLFRLPPEA
jgi:hypothetical protein